MRGPLLIVLLLLPGRQGAAQSLEERPAGAAGLALAGAGVSALRIPAAVWLNPSLLPLSGPHLGLELGLLSDASQLTATAEVNQTSTARDIEGPRLSPAVALAHPLGLPWLWGGLAYRIARQAHRHYPPQEIDDRGQPSRAAPGRYLGSDLSLQQHTVALALAMGGRRAALGASLELSHISLAHRRALWAGLPADAHLLADPRLDVTVELKAQRAAAVGVLVGCWVRPLPWLEGGFAARLPTPSELSGEVSLTPGPRPPAGMSAITARDGRARLDFPLPLELRGGLTVGPTRWRVLIEAGYRRWSSAAKPVAELEGAALLLGREPLPPLEQPLQRLDLAISLRDSFSVHGGLELRPWGEWLTLRAGYAFQRGASVTGHPTPVLLDLDRHVLGMGLHTRLGSVRLGAAFSHSFEASVTAKEGHSLIVNPLDPRVTGPVGAGVYETSRVQVIFEAQVGW